jgi:hypothetical protein
MQDGGAAARPESGPAAAQPPAEAVDMVGKLIRCGRAADAERELLKTAAKLGDGGRQAVIEAILAEPDLNNALVGLEQWLDGVTDLRAAAPLATWWALPASGIDLEPRVEEVREFIDRYPSEGRKIPILQEHAADWLMRRIALFMDPAPQMPGIRSAITMLVEMTASKFPDSSRNFAEVLAEYDDDKLWLSMAEMIVRLQLVVTDA